jgi:hypothetical protein
MMAIAIGRMLSLYIYNEGVFIELPWQADGRRLQIRSTYRFEFIGADHSLEATKFLGNTIWLSGLQSGCKPDHFLKGGLWPQRKLNSRCAKVVTCDLRDGTSLYSASALR